MVEITGFEVRQRDVLQESQRRLALSRSRDRKKDNNCCDEEREEPLHFIFSRERKFFLTCEPQLFDFMILCEHIESPSKLERKLNLPRRGSRRGQLSRSPGGAAT